MRSFFNPKWLSGGILLGILAPVQGFCQEALGGATTIYETGRQAFSLPAANMTSDRQTRFFIGNSFFKKNWVEAPSSTEARDGLGPHFIARSCGGCHALDGRGAPPAFEQGKLVEPPVALLFRLSVPTEAGMAPDPHYGGQLNNFAISGVLPEAQIEIRYEESSGSFPDGESYRLRQPFYRFHDLNYGALHPKLQVSPRIAPQMIGLGLLEAIQEKDILANARLQANGIDGISGRPNYVEDRQAGSFVLGRFGWKANVGSIAHQVAGAFNGDIGITSSLFPQEECMPAQADCQNALRGGTPEISDEKLQAVIFYSQTLAVPAQRKANHPQVIEGKNLFQIAQCSRCHVPSYQTGTLAGVPEVSGQRIFPYTDLLLHDMGEGLADHRPDGWANGREWKTPPLWGIGLIREVNGHTFYLHDGRARNLQEAILWHGGEAEGSRQKFVQFSPKQRAALLEFLNSL